MNCRRRLLNKRQYNDCLQGKEYFSNWLALTDSNPDFPVIGVFFELLQFVDIGGTLHVNIHLDELLLVCIGYCVIA